MFRQEVINAALADCNKLTSAMENALRQAQGERTRESVRGEPRLGVPVVRYRSSFFNSHEVSPAQIEKRLFDLFSGIHDERAISGDRFVEWFAGYP